MRSLGVYSSDDVELSSLNDNENDERNRRTNAREKRITHPFVSTFRCVRHGGRGWCTRCLWCSTMI